MVPIETLGSDITIGILTLLRREETGGIDTIEQAALIEELNKHYGMSIYDIAQHLGRSPSWVSMRLGVIEDLSPLVREKIMSGAFPARAYLYGIKGFTRVNKIGRQQVDAFVGAVSGKGLSTRELFVLSRAYFSAGGAIRSLICEGNVRRALRLLLEEAQGVDDATLPQREREFMERWLSGIM
jgi:predicted transcriptional regulator